MSFQFTLPSVSDDWLTSTLYYLSGLCAIVPYCTTSDDRNMINVKWHNSPQTRPDPHVQPSTRVFFTLRPCYTFAIKPGTKRMHFLVLHFMRKKITFNRATIVHSSRAVYKSVLSWSRTGWMKSLWRALNRFVVCTRYVRERSPCRPWTIVIDDGLSFVHSGATPSDRIRVPVSLS